MHSENRGGSPNKKRNAMLVLAVLLFVAVIIGISYLCIPLFRSLSQPEAQEQLRTWISSIGFGGWLIFLCLQMLQVIIAFIPGEPVQLLAGVLYGTWGGLATCLLGSVLASVFILLIVRKGGEKLVVKLFGKNKLDEFAFLKDSKRSELITFFLFLLPGLPKDLLTYLGGLTRIPPVKFIALSTIARIPALAASTLLGSSASTGNLGLTLLITAVVIVIAIVFLIYRDKVMAWIHRTGQGNPPA